jgi:hypothetical protein
MVGIENAFAEFVKRISHQEKSKAEEPLSKYKSYSENELLSNLDAKMPNLQIEDDVYYAMPKYYPMDVLPPSSVPVMPQIMNRDRQYMDLARGGVASMFRKRKRYADGGEIRRYEDLEYNPSTGNFEKVIREGPYWDTKEYSDPIIKIFDKEKGFIDIDKGVKGANHLLTQRTINGIPINEYLNNIPTIDPFSGQQVSAQDQLAFTQPQAEIFPQQELPTVTPEAPFQPYIDKQTSYDDVSNRLENIFNNPAVKGYLNFITGSGNPFQDINQFTTAQQNVINQAIQNAANQGRTNITYADYPQTGIAQLMDDGFTPMEYLKTLGSSMFGNPVDQIKTTLGQFSYNPETNKIFDRYDFQRQLGNNLGTPYDVNINLRNNPVQRTVNVGSADLGTQALGASVGNLDFATMNALRNNADLLNTITGQTVNMANGGLTKTVPPVRGPNPQGVESLFKRRYN